MTMKTSIIVLNWNGLDMLKNCINHIRQNTNRDEYELIVVDNGSKEPGTLEYIQNECKSPDKAIFNQKNRGFAAANNQGALISTGELLCFVNNDCYVGKGWLTNMRRTLFSWKDCVAVGPMGNPKNATVNRVPTGCFQHKGQFLKDTKVPILIAFCLLVRKEAFEKAGKFCEDFGLGNFEDNYLCRKLQENGGTLWVSAEADVNHPHPSSTFQKNNVDYWQLMEKNKQIYEKKILNEV